MGLSIALPVMGTKFNRKKENSLFHYLNRMHKVVDHYSYRVQTFGLRYVFITPSTL
jgi:hypothetical protein